MTDHVTIVRAGHYSITCIYCVNRLHQQFIAVMLTLNYILISIVLYRCLSAGLDTIEDCTIVYDVHLLYQYIREWWVVMVTNGTIVCCSRFAHSN